MELLNMEWIKSNAGLFTLGIFLMANLAYMENRMGSMENRLNARMDQVENRLNARMDQVENRLNARMDKLETEIGKLETEIKELHSLIITLIADNKTLKTRKTKRKIASAPSSVP